MSKPIQISIADFVQASAKYVDAKVKKANTSAGGTLSLAEAKALPKDLRDNFAHFREAKHPHGTVGVKEFAESFKAYVEATAKKADKNKDGYLTITDSKSLPADLRDNFWHYFHATAVSQVSSVDKVTETVRKALADHVNNVLFNPAAEEGASFRYACLDNVTTGTRANQVKREMLAEAAQWTPESADWEKNDFNQTVVYSGRFWQLYTEVRLPTNKAPSVYVEID